MINEKDFKQSLFDYALEKYGKRIRKFFEKFHAEFPERGEEMEPELYFTN